MQKLTLSEAVHGLKSARADYARLIERADFDIGFYRPEKVDLQEPHKRDELYMIAAGSGEFVSEGDAQAVGPGDLLFVPAGAEHRFKNFSDDFATWVVFFGQRLK